MKAGLLNGEMVVFWQPSRKAGHQAGGEGRRAVAVQKMAAIYAIGMELFGVGEGPITIHYVELVDGQPISQARRVEGDEKKTTFFDPTPFRIKPPKLLASTWRGRLNQYFNPRRQPLSCPTVKLVESGWPINYPGAPQVWPSGPPVVSRPSPIWLEASKRWEKWAGVDVLDKPENAAAIRFLRFRILWKVALVDNRPRLMHTTGAERRPARKFAKVSGLSEEAARTRLREVVPALRRHRRLEYSKIALILLIWATFLLLRG